MSTAEMDRTAELDQSERITVVHVENMTCGRCIQQVSDELKAVAGVKSVSIDLHSGEVSPVTVVSEGALDADAVHAALDPAGYTVAAIRSAA